MNVLSLFDGMSCGRVALDRAEIKVKKYFASEIDKFSIKISQKNYPDIIQLGDIKNWRNWSIPKIDLLIGGSPCQGFSFSGKKTLNFDDPRSKLFFEYVDILNFYKPKFFMLENVTMRSAWSSIISKYLNVNPVEINSSLVSAQNRNRLYWTNISFPDIVEKNIFWKDIQEVDAQNVFYYNENSFNWIFKTQQRREKFKIYNQDTKEKMQTVEASHRKLYSNQRCFGIKDTNGIRYISPIECERLQTLPDNYTEGVSRTQRYKMLGNGFTIDVVAHILNYLPDKYKE